MGYYTSINERYARLRNNNGGVIPSGVNARSVSSLETPASWFLDWAGGGNSAAGPTVNDDSALSLAAVYACNRVIANAFAALPVGLFRREGGGTYPDDSRPEHRVVAEEPSPLYTSFVFRQTMQMHLNLRGNAYARLYRDGRDTVREMRIVHPSYVRPLLYKGRVWYDILEGGMLGDSASPAEVVRDTDMLHVKSFCMDGLVGKSPIAQHRDTIGIGLSNRAFLSEIHRNGGRVRGAITHPDQMTAEQVAGIRAGFIDAVNSGKFPVLENGADFKAISLTPADAEYIRQHSLTQLDICAIYGVPPHKIANLDRATFANIEHQSIEFVQETVLPVVKNWEPELKRKLLSESLRPSRFYRFNLEGRMRGATLDRMRAYQLALTGGWMNADEIRELESMNPLPDGQGQIYLTPLNMVPSSQLLDDGGQPANDTENGTGATQGSR